MKLRVTIDAQSFDVEVGSLDARPIPVAVDGETFMVWPEENEQAAQSAEQPPAAIPVAVMAPVRVPAPSNAAAAGGMKTVMAPIPGVIISVSVKAGDKVTFGQELCVLEAMKMKNIIRANRAGTVAAVCVAAGDQVRHGQALVEYTD